MCSNPRKGILNMEKDSNPPDFLGEKTNSVLFLPLRQAVQEKPLIMFPTKKLFLIFLFVIVGFSTLFGLFGEKKGNQSFFEENVLFEEQLILSNGNTLLPIVSLPGSEPKIVKKISVVITAYSSTPWETWGDPFVTASGSWVRDGVIANNLLPFGTKVRVPEIYGDKVFVVEDRMHSRKGNYHFDVWFPSYWQALEFGAKKTYIEVLEG